MDVTDEYEYIDVRDRLRELGYPEPSGFLFLPLNFDKSDNSTGTSNLRRSVETLTLKKLFVQKGLPYSALTDESSMPVVSLHSDDVSLLPIVLWFAEQNKDLLPVAVDVVKSYFDSKGYSSKKVEFSIVVENRRVDYKGPSGQIGAVLEAFTDEKTE